MKFISEIKEFVICIDKSLSNWECSRCVDITERLSMLSINDMNLESVLQNITNSHINAIKELRNILSCKIKYMNQIC